MAISPIPKLKRWFLRLITTGWIALALPALIGQSAATATSPSTKEAPYAPTMTFDVASVRENKNADIQAGITMSGQFLPDTTMLRVINWRIDSLVSYAYGVDESQISGVPKWPSPTVFVIEAKGDSEADARMAKLTREQQRAEQQHMLQALLEDRFKLKTHWETKEGDIYNLVVAKGGPKLGSEGSLPPSADDKKLFGNRPIPPLRQVNDGQGYDFIGYRCSLGQLVAILTSQFGRPVTDKTGLTGKYDFVLKYKGRWDRDRDADDPDPTPPMDRALQDELGLKVLPAKGATKVLIIDHVEKPSEN